MKWENPEFMDYFMGELPKIKRYQNDNEIKSEISSLEKVLSTYNAFTTEKQAFLNEIAEKISAIKNLKESWYGLNLYEIETYVKLHRFCMISGEGGIGKEKVIICNNNKNLYYRDPIGGTVFIRKDYLNKFLEGHTVKYFAFTERFIPETGYADETSLHFEIVNGKIVKEIKNSSSYDRWNSDKNPICSACPHINIY